MDKTTNSKREVITYWVKSYTGEFFNYAFQRTSCNETAEDLVQETFLAAYENFDSFKGNSSPKTWLYAILKHKIIEYHRNVIKGPPTSNFNIDNYSKYFNHAGNWLDSQLIRNQEMEEVSLLDNQLFLNTLDICLSNLPEPWRLAVQLKYLSSKKSAEICKELHITTSNYWQIIHRAKLKLRNCIDINWFNNQ